MNVGRGTMCKKVIVYTLEFCPNCEELKNFLSGKNIPFEERDFMSPASLAEMRVNGIFSREAPVLQCGERFITPNRMFTRTGLDENSVISFLEVW